MERTGVKSTKLSALITKLYLSTKDAWVRIAYTIVRDRGDAEDIVHSVLADYLNKTDINYAEQQVQSYISRAVVHKAVRFKHRKAQVYEAEYEWELELDYGDPLKVLEYLEASQLNVTEYCKSNDKSIRTYQRNTKGIK